MSQVLGSTLILSQFMMTYDDFVIDRLSKPSTSREFSFLLTIYTNSNFIRHSADPF